MASRMEAKELLAEEHYRSSDRDQEAVTTYKESKGFQWELRRVERDSYYYGYLVALRWFQTLTEIY